MNEAVLHEGSALPASLGECLSKCRFPGSKLCMANPLRVKEFPGASWLLKITLLPANSLLLWQS